MTPTPSPASGQPDEKGQTVPRRFRKKPVEIEAMRFDGTRPCIEKGESGASLRAAGYRVVAERPARAGWDCPSRPRDEGRDHIPRTLWEAMADV